MRYILYIIVVYLFVYGSNADALTIQQMPEKQKTSKYERYIPPASSIGELNSTEQLICKQQGGKPFFAYGRMICNMPTTDKNKPCGEFLDCQGVCLKVDEENTRWQGISNEPTGMADAQGRCSPFGNPSECVTLYDNTRLCPFDSR